MTLSREIALRVRQSLLKNSPCLYLNELQQLKMLRNQMNSIGRNIHYIISGDRYVTVNDVKFREEIDEVLKMKNEIKNLISSLVDSAINRFN